LHLTVGAMTMRFGSSIPPIFIESNNDAIFVPSFSGLFSVPRSSTNTQKPERADFEKPRLRRGPFRRSTLPGFDVHGDVVNVRIDIDTSALISSEV
jgi:hypothetical protein